MAQTIDLDKLDELSVDERLKLLETVWLTLEAETQSAPSPEWHYAEIDRRLAKRETGPAKTQPWCEALRDLKASLQK